MKRNILIWLALSSCIGVQAQTVDLKSVAKISYSTTTELQSYLGNDDRFGAPTLVGDINNDGVDDLAVGAFLDDDGQTNAGAVYILFMNADETVNDVQKISNLDGNLGNIIPYNARFGHNVEALGDLNDDGVEDIAVSGWNQSSGAFDRAWWKCSAILDGIIPIRLFVVRSLSLYLMSSCLALPKVSARETSST